MIVSYLGFYFDESCLLGPLFCIFLLTVETSYDIDTELFSSCFFLPYSLTVATEPPQTTSTALPSMCTGILTSISSTSVVTVSPSATTGPSPLQLGTTMVPPISLSPSPTTSVIAQQATNQGSLETAGIAVSATFATVAMLIVYLV